MDRKEVLIDLGLADDLARVYLASLELGPSGATAIAEKAKIQRTNFYHISRGLIGRGLLRQTKKGTATLFVAEPPEKIVELEKNKLARLEEKLPELKAITNSSDQKPKVFYFDGADGIRQINNDTLKHKGEIIGFTSPRYLSLEKGITHRAYVSDRLVAKNKVRVIGEVSNEVVALKEKDATEMRETRMLPKELFTSEIELAIYGDRIAIIDYKEVFGLIIEGKEITKTLKMVFELVWNSGRIVS